jgi:hypothetical protein
MDTTAEEARDQLRRTVEEFRGETATNAAPALLIADRLDILTAALDDLRDKLDHITDRIAA